MKYRFYKWLVAFGHSLRVTIILTILLSFIFSFEVFSNSYPDYYLYIYEYLKLFFGLILVIGLYALIITFLCSSVFGIPTVLILNKLEFKNPIYGAIIGGLIIFCFLEKPFNSFEWYYLIFILYGFLCGYAFMYGYKRVPQ